MCNQLLPTDIEALGVPTRDFIRGTVIPAEPWLATDPKACSAMFSVARAHCSEVINGVIDRAIPLCGGDGVSDGLPSASYLNKVRPFRIYGGANEIHNGPFLAAPAPRLGARPLSKVASRTWPTCSK